MNERELIKMAMAEHFLDKEQIRSSVLHSCSLNNADIRHKKLSKSRMPVVVLAAVIFCLSTVTVFALSRFLSPGEASRALGNSNAAIAFEKKDFAATEESVTESGYTVTFLGMASGHDLVALVNDETKNYAVVAITNADGSSIVEPHDTDFFVSPLIHGLDPSRFNLITMNGQYTKRMLDGILYYLIECDYIEMFADRGLYLCITKSTFYDEKAFIFEENGNIQVAADYPSLNVLFTLPIDPEKANPQMANDYISSALKNEDEANLSYMQNYTPLIPVDAYGNPDLAKVLHSATPIEDSRQLLTQSSGEAYLYDFYSESMNIGSESTIVTHQVNTYNLNDSFIHSASSYEGETTVIWYLVCTKRENGVLEAVIYQK